MGLVGWGKVMGVGVGVRGPDGGKLHSCSLVRVVAAVALTTEALCTAQNPPNLTYPHTPHLVRNCTAVTGAAWSAKVTKQKPLARVQTLTCGGGGDACASGRLAPNGAAVAHLMPWF